MILVYFGACPWLLEKKTKHEITLDSLDGKTTHIQPIRAFQCLLNGGCVDAMPQRLVGLQLHLAMSKLAGYPTAPIQHTKNEENIQIYIYI